ncbi:MAG TPA: ElyC/SanA/YdcF family protein [Solirubrobacterales bacterium]|nr:ElyC/SanA/YdcF family protein [Solirubrobacterales bacterium]
MESKPGFLKRHRRVVLPGLVLCVLGLLLIAGTNAYVLIRGGGPTVSDAKSADPAETAIVLGALVEADGRMSEMLADRVDQAANLWHAGKVKHILVSGDHGQWRYDEPTTMKRALVGRGVPEDVIFTDHAGFDTNATMVRARRIFDVDDALVVTQGFHMKRALFLADAAGIDAEGVTSDLHEYGGRGLKGSVREVASRVKAVGDVIFGGSVMGGPEIPIGGTASASWGPAPPEGTPPAGAPGG